MNQEERIRRFMQLMNQASQETGITYAVQHGENMVVFDLHAQEPVELEIQVGTEVKKEGGRTTVTTFDRTNIDEGRAD